MDFRVKARHFFAHSKGLTSDKYDPSVAVSQGEHEWMQRTAVNQLWANGETEKFEEAKAKLLRDLKKRKLTAPTILSIKLKHGDIVTMHGNELQRIYEVSCTNLKPNQRFLTLANTYTLSTKRTHLANSATA